MNLNGFVSDAIKNVEGQLTETNWQLCVKFSTPLSVGYILRLDIT